MSGEPDIKEGQVWRSSQKQTYSETSFEYLYVERIYLNDRNEDCVYCVTRPLGSFQGLWTFANLRRFYTLVPLEEIPDRMRNWQAELRRLVEALGKDDKPRIDAINRAQDCLGLEWRGGKLVDKQR